jgi:hypothetical protein
MNDKSKMRGKLKGWGRCRISGHEQFCVVTREIREAGTMTRAKEKKRWKRELNEYLNTRY